MKKILYIYLLLIIALSGCRQDSDVVNPVSSDKSSDLNKDLVLKVPEVVCADEEFIVSLESKNLSGKTKLQISEDNGKSWFTVAETPNSDSKSESFYLNLKEGNYKIRGGFTSEANGNFEYSEVVERTVSGCQDCEGLVLDPDLSAGSFVVNSGTSENFTAEYTVLACDQDYYGLELTGELIQKAVYKSSEPGNAEVKKHKNNTGISWEIGDIKKGFAKTFKVTFSLNVPKVPYGTLIPLTSGFVLQGKSGSGKNVRVGNYNEIFVQVQ